MPVNSKTTTKYFILAHPCTIWLCLVVICLVFVNLLSNYIEITLKTLENFKKKPKISSTTFIAQICGGLAHSVYNIHNTC